MEVTRTVLVEIGATGIDSYLVLNKSDRLSDVEKRALKAEYPDAIMISTLNQQDVAAMREHHIRFFERDMEDFTIELPYEQSGLIGEIRRNRARVVSEEADEIGMTYRIRTHLGVYEKLSEMIAEKRHQ